MLRFASPTDCSPCDEYLARFRVLQDRAATAIGTRGMASADSEPLLNEVSLWNG